jgi:ATP-dependent Clp protease ATP-binding subunit ClpA
MYARFTDRARRTMQLANEEALRFNHEYIGTEHILLGLVKEGEGVAATVLKHLHIELRDLRREVEKIVQRGPDPITAGKLPQTPRAKKVLEYAIDESRQLRHNYIGTEHLLLGLLREEEGVAAQILFNLGLKLETIRDAVTQLLEGRALEPPPALEPPRSQLPEGIQRTLQKLDSQIEQLNQEKEEAIVAQDFVRAASLRDQVCKLDEKRRIILHEWRSQNPD